MLPLLSKGRERIGKELAEQIAQEIQCNNTICYIVSFLSILSLYPPRFLFINGVVAGNARERNIGKELIKVLAYNEYSP